MSIVWGIPYLLIKIAVEGVSVPVLVLARTAAGVAVLAGPGLAGGHSWPIAEVLLVATCYAIAPLIAARYLADVPTLPLTAACLSVAALIYTAPALMTWPDQMPSHRVLVALGEPLTVYNIAGLALILAGSILATRTPPDPDPGPQPETEVSRAGPR
jgi:drug/metabolite transporter (DMT)-like permease